MASFVFSFYAAVFCNDLIFMLVSLSSQETGGDDF